MSHWLYSAKIQMEYYQGPLLLLIFVLTAQKKKNENAAIPGGRRGRTSSSNVFAITGEKGGYGRGTLKAGGGK